MKIQVVMRVMPSAHVDQFEDTGFLNLKIS